MTAQNAKNYRDAMVSLGQGRLDETTRHNTTTEQQNAQERADRRTQFLMTYQRQVGEDLRNLANDAQKRVDYIRNKKIDIQKAVTEGKLDQGTADAMLSTLQ